VTFILNILHNDMSLLAADQRAQAVQPKVLEGGAAISHVNIDQAIEGFNKITLIRSKLLAVGIAGHTHEHRYFSTLGRSSSADEALMSIRSHVNGFPRLHNRAELLSLSSFMPNEGIATFLDSAMRIYFSMTYRFSLVDCSIRLHRPRGGTRLLYAGSGAEHFEKVVGKSEIESFVASTRDTCNLEACILWVRDVYKRVSDSDASSGDEPAFVLSTTSNPQFQAVERC